MEISSKHFTGETIAFAPQGIAFDLFERKSVTRLFEHPPLTVIGRRDRTTGNPVMDSRREPWVHILPISLPDALHRPACNTRAWQEPPGVAPNKTLRGMGQNLECRFESRPPNPTVLQRTGDASCCSTAAAKIRRRRPTTRKLPFACIRPRTIFASLRIPRAVAASALGSSRSHR